MRVSPTWMLCGLLAGCSRSTPARENAVVASVAPAPVTGRPDASSSPDGAVLGPRPAPVEQAEARPAVSAERARRVLFQDASPTRCANTDEVRCLLEVRYDAFPGERKLALALFDQSGDVPGVEREHRMDGGFRGTIHIVPELPVGKYGRHLAWVAAAQREMESFFAELTTRSSAPLRYRHGALVWRFFRSVGRTTPSAYAEDWEIGYNVSGSLLGSEASVRDTLFHEIFHLNDEAHGGWSRRVLGDLVDGIVAKCGTSVACLEPYAPFDTKVRGGTYYAFQPNNGDRANEYAAELATRYFVEQRAALRGQQNARAAFKCRTPENARAYAAIVSEFFGGVDATRPCP